MKKVLFLFFVLIIFTIFSITSSAHSGRTDYAGGHYNHSSGDYHYHHGKPAHDHYDIDGDGIADCPYYTKVDKETTSSSEFDIKKYIGALLVSAFISFILTCFLIGLIIRFFKKTEESISYGHVIVWIAATIIISILIYDGF